MTFLSSATDWLNGGVSPTASPLSRQPSVNSPNPTGPVLINPNNQVTQPSINYSQEDLRAARGQSLMQLGATLLAAAQGGTPLGTRGEIIARGLPAVGDSYRSTLYNLSRGKAEAATAQRDSINFEQQQNAMKYNMTAKVRFQQMLQSDPSKLGVNEQMAKMLGQLPVDDAIDTYKKWVENMTDPSKLKFDFVTPDANGAPMGIKGNTATYIQPGSPNTQPFITSLTQSAPSGLVDTTRPQSIPLPAPPSSGGQTAPAISTKQDMPTKVGVAGATKQAENTADDIQAKRVNTDGAFETLGVMTRALNASQTMGDSEFGPIQGADPSTWTGSAYRLTGGAAGMGGTNFEKQDKLRSIVKDAATTLVKMKMNKQGSISDTERAGIEQIVGGLSSYDKNSFLNVANEQMVSASQIIMQNLRSGIYTLDEANQKAESIGLPLKVIANLADQGRYKSPEPEYQKHGLSDNPTNGSTVYWAPPTGGQ